MSGIVGIVNFDGAPIDRALLSRMTAALDYRGPDARRTWIADPGDVAFGHTLLRTTYEAEHEQQPFTLDGNTWIVADCRVDAREELLAELRAKGRDASLYRPDVELILHAWHVWGQECVEHLLGDFAFAIWDAPRRRLFCARDHMGVKPFYYAHIGSTLIFSNTLDCVRMHPAVSDTLNDLAIADFLLFDVNQEPDTTVFAGVQRIPRGHCLCSTPGVLHLRRYWTLPIDEPIYFKRADDYTERFKDLLHDSVKDRLRTDKVGIFMSGGLDSPTLAATACRVLRERGVDSGVQAFTTIADGLDNNERYYAGLVANSLRIPIQFFDLGDNIIDPNWDIAAVRTPEPATNPLRLITDRDQFLAVSAYGRVCFHGEGPDNALRYEWQPYLTYLLRQRRFGRLIGDVSRHIVRHKRVPLLTSIPRIIKAKRRGEWWRLSFPSWLEPVFESRLGLRSRWEERERTTMAPSTHPVRSKSHGSFDSLLWELMFRDFDPGVTRTPLEVRHPFLDLRLLRYMLAVPPIPWCRAKYLLRRTMRGALPNAVLRRPKSPLTTDTEWVGARRLGLPPLRATPEFRRYINPERVPLDANENMIGFRVDLRPRALSYWLENLPQKPTQLTKEESKYECVTK